MADDEERKRKALEDRVAAIRARVREQRESRGVAPADSPEPHLTPTNSLDADRLQAIRERVQGHGASPPGESPRSALSGEDRIAAIKQRLKGVTLSPTDSPVSSPTPVTESSLVTSSPSMKTPATETPSFLSVSTDSGPQTVIAVDSDSGTPAAVVASATAATEPDSKPTTTPEPTSAAAPPSSSPPSPSPAVQTPPLVNSSPPSDNKNSSSTASTSEPSSVKTPDSSSVKTPNSSSASSSTSASTSSSSSPSPSSAANPSPSTSSSFSSSSTSQAQRAWYRHTYSKSGHSPRGLIESFPLVHCINVSRSGNTVVITGKIASDLQQEELKNLIMEVKSTPTIAKVQNLVEDVRATGGCLYVEDQPSISSSLEFDLNDQSIDLPTRIQRLRIITALYLKAEQKH